MPLPPHCSGTNTPSHEKWVLPVPRRPWVCQVSSTTTWDFGSTITRAKGMPSAVGCGSPSFSTTQPQKTHSACSIPLALSLSGCAVGPDYVRPETEVPIPDAWHNEISEEMSREETDVREWWTAFNDTMLTHLIARADTMNRDLRVAIANIEVEPTWKGRCLRSQSPGAGDG